MPTTITHSFVGISSAHLFSNHAPCVRLLTLSLIAANLPDIDILTLYLGYADSHVLGHRGICHSISFALCLGPCLTVAYNPSWKIRDTHWLWYSIYFFLLICSHGMLDSLNTSGVAFLAPFSNTRYFFSIHPVVESPRIEDFASLQSSLALLSEIQQIWGPLALCLLASQPYTGLLPGVTAWKELIARLRTFLQSPGSILGTYTYSLRSLFY